MAVVKPEKRLEQEASCHITRSNIVSGYKKITVYKLCKVFISETNKQILFFDTADM